jgi:hypothetical protein
MAANTSLASDHGACVHLASRSPEEVTKMIKRYRKVVLWSCVDLMKFRTGKDRKVTFKPLKSLHRISFESMANLTPTLSTFTSPAPTSCMCDL